MSWANWLRNLHRINTAVKLNRRQLLVAGAITSAGAGAAQAARAIPPSARIHEPAPMRTGRLPFERHRKGELPLAQPGRDYRPVHSPNIQSLGFEIIEGWKQFHLVAEPIVHVVAQGLTINAWGFNGSTPGPTIEAVEGDAVRILVENRLPAPISVHWHGMIVPNGMDGVAGVTQPAILPGQTFAYEFVLPHAATFMYHPHFDNMTEEGMGLTGMFIVHPREPEEPLPDRDYAIMLHEWFIEGGAAKPNPIVQSDFNILTMNGRAFPEVEHLVAERNERIRIRFGNLSAIDNHPIHLHGHAFRIVATDGGPIPRSAQWPETTVLVPIGSTRDIEFFADNPGDWVMHCHMTHHTMNQMGHDIPNMIGVDMGALEEKIKKVLPDYMTMGVAGMGEMAYMQMDVPANSIPMRGLKGQYGPTVFGGMATILKVRERVEGWSVPGFYDHPEGSRAYLVVDSGTPPPRNVSPPPGTRSVVPPRHEHGDH